MFQVNTIMGKTTGMVHWPNAEKGSTMRCKLYMPYGVARDKVIHGVPTKARDQMFIPVVAFGTNADNLFKEFGPDANKVPSPRRVCLIGEWQPALLQPGKDQKLVKATVNIGGNNVEITLDAVALAKILAKDHYYTGWEFRVIYWRYADDIPKNSSVASNATGGLVATISTDANQETEGDIVSTEDSKPNNTFNTGDPDDDAPF